MTNDNVMFEDCEYRSEEVLQYDKLHQNVLELETKNESLDSYINAYLTNIPDLKGLESHISELENRKKDNCGRIAELKEEMKELAKKNRVIARLEKEIEKQKEYIND